MLHCITIIKVRSTCPTWSHASADMCVRFGKVHTERKHFLCLLVALQCSALRNVDGISSQLGVSMSMCVCVCVDWYVSCVWFTVKARRLEDMNGSDSDAKLSAPDRRHVLFCCVAHKRLKVCVSNKTSASVMCV